MSQVLDATGAAFFARQLEHIKTQAYNVEYPELMARQAFPVSNEAHPGATSITYRTYDKAGKAKIINNQSFDLPRVDVGGHETTHPVVTIADSFGYSRKEILASQKTGYALDQERAMAARRVIEEEINLLVWNGDAEYNLPGLFNNSDIPTADLANGAGGTPGWLSKTPDEIIADINSTGSTIFNLTATVERPNTLLLPPDFWSYIMDTPRSSTSDTTIAQYIVNNSTWIRNIADIMPINELSGAGTSGVDIMVMYDKNPRKVEIEIPEEVIFHPEQEKGVGFEVPVTAEFGGLHVRYPKSMYIREKLDVVT